LRTVAHSSEITSVGHLQSLLIAIIPTCEPLSDDRVLQLTECFKASPEDPDPLLDLTFGCLPGEVRSFVGFLQDPALRFVAPTGAFVISTDLSAAQLPSPRPLIAIPKPVFPVPFALLNIEEQDKFMRYFQRLQDERDSLLDRELAMQRAKEELDAMEGALAELEEQRTSLVDRFMALRNAVAPAVDRDPGGSGTLRERQLSAQSAKQLEIARAASEKRAALFNHQAHLLENRVRIATESMGGGHLEALEALDAFPSEGEVPPIGAARQRGSGVAREVRPAVLPEALARRMRPWNVVTEEAVDAIASELAPAKQRTADPNDRIERLTRKLAKFDAVLKKFEQ
jgi:hypothetical protein